MAASVTPPTAADRDAMLERLRQQLFVYGDALVARGDAAERARVEAEARAARRVRRAALSAVIFGSNFGANTSCFGSLARLAITHLEQKGMIMPVGERHHAQLHGRTCGGHEHARRDNCERILHPHGEQIHYGMPDACRPSWHLERLHQGPDANVDG